MPEFRSSKKTIIIVVILFVIINLGFLIAYLAGFKIIDDKLTFEECNEKLATFNGSDLMDYIKIVGEVEKINPNNRFRGNFINDRAYFYYKCKLENGTNVDSAYDEAIKFYNNSELSEIVKNEYFNKINKLKNYSKEDDIRLLIANGLLDVICPDRLKDACLYSGGAINETREQRCNDICAYVENAIKDNDFYQEGVMKLNWFYNIDDTKELSYETLSLPENIDSIGWWRIALAYRVGGEADAKKLCDNFTEDYAKNRCEDKVLFHLNFIKNNNIDCDEYYLDRIRAGVCSPNPDIQK